MDVVLVPVQDDVDEAEAEDGGWEVVKGGEEDVFSPSV